MVQSLLYWCELYKWFKTKAVCIDIETTCFNGSIAVVGIYRPKEGKIEYESYVRGINLSDENLRKALDGCMMLITYNGIVFDVQRINREFPGIIPDKIPVIDLYRFACRLGMKTNLKILENTLGVERSEDFTKKRRIAVKLWKRYEKYKDQKALEMLVEYNREDTVNLYPIAEALVKRVYQQMA